MIGVHRLTQVLTTKGKKYIKDLCPGDIVRTKELDGSSNECTVESLDCTFCPNLLLIIFSDSSSIICTRRTKFLLSGGKSKYAEDVIYNDELVSASGQRITVKSIAFYYKSLDVYTLKLLYNDSERYICVGSTIYANIGHE